MSQIPLPELLDEAVDAGAKAFSGRDDYDDLHAVQKHALRSAALDVITAAWPHLTRSLGRRVVPVDESEDDGW